TVSADLALFQRLQLNIKVSASAETSGGSDILNSGICLDDSRELLELFRTHRKGNIRRNPDVPCKAAGILLREKSLRHDDVEVNAQACRSKRHAMHEKGMILHPP